MFYVFAAIATVIIFIAGGFMIYAGMRYEAGLPSFRQMRRANAEYIAYWKD